jgi:hypothetical protein
MDTAAIMRTRMPAAAWSIHARTQALSSVAPTLFQDVNILFRTHVL